MEGNLQIFWGKKGSYKKTNTKMRKTQVWGKKTKGNLVNQL